MDRQPARIVDRRDYGDMHAGIARLERPKISSRSKYQERLKGREVFCLECRATVYYPCRVCYLKQRRSVPGDAE